ncbi:type III secretion system inner membrane ring subunit SctD [Endozoicomonas sp. SM1973]|uniref:Type III secretion system inner membrane ring subunit SctD n=1 Tax=Spartinivicinus marinus TaxID=2994442 RepID=A0A853I461_9GAMM|nr:type III secretion system inner membrane ring subunit SctD [Spartinivicinus marinus]MCX4024661.1 type III secretion system inner membrane ring subunit SctD [Spartinivicinus marinus]NYZ66312.1 type III secretion system inner membrane ring subunit SctD [Spartinivicinus marinus]
MKPQWKIKVLSGTHQGAEIQLVEGEFLLGSDINTADLVFQDNGVPALLGRLIVTVEDLRFQRGEEPFELLVDGQPETELLISLVSQQQLQAGELLIAVARFDEPWALIEKAVKDNESITADEPLADSVPSRTNQKPTNRQINNSAKKQPKKKLTQKSKFHYSRGLALLSSVAGTILLVWFISFAWPQKVDSGVQPTKQLSPLEKAQQVVKQLTLENVKITWQASRQRLLLTGYVPDTESKLQLKNELESASLFNRINLYVEADIIRSVQFILDNNGLGHINVTSGKTAGEVRLMGLLDNGKRWAKVEKMLKHDVPGLKGYQVDFDSSRQHIAALTQVLEENHLLGQLQIVSVGNYIEIRGEINQKLENKLNQLIEHFETNIGQSGLIKTRNMPLFADDPLHLPVKSISIGSVPYIVLKNNQKYMVGARLPNGYRLAKIDNDFIKLRNQDQVVKITIKPENYAN